MNASDAVDPTDARIQELLAQIAERTSDKDRRERIVDLILTLPPIAQWPPEMLDKWRDTRDYIRGLRRQHELRRLNEMFGDTDF